MFNIFKQYMTARTKTEKGELLNVLLSFRKAFLALAIFSGVINILLLVPALYMLQIYDRVLMSRNQNTLLMLTIIMLIMYLFVGLLERVRSQIMIRIGNVMDNRLSGRVFSATFSRVVASGSGNSSQPFHDLTNVRQFLTSTGLFAFFDAPWTPIYIIAIFIIHPMLGVFSIGSAFFLSCMALLTELSSRNPLSEANKVYNSASSFAAVNFRNAEAIEAMGMLNNVKKRWFPKHERFLKLQEKASERASMIQAITKFARLSFQSLMLGAGAYLAIKDIITPGGMIAASIIMGRALSPIDMAIGTWKQFVSARDSYKRLAELFNIFPEREAGMSLPPPQGMITVSHLTGVAPGTNKQILRDISFEAKVGEVTAIIGPSASGKSTLAKHLVGVWQPFTGVVRLDGAEISKWSREEIGPYIGYLPQDIELLEGAVAQNIARFGDIDSEKVVQAANIAGVHEMILQFPQGYDTQIGEGGSFLSGGQRQRIALARAVYGDPVLIVLDEPNSNLDDAGEIALMNAFHKLKKAKKTIFVITHKTSILSIVDKIILLANGVIAAYGPRNDVLAALQRAKQQAATAQSPQKVPLKRVLQ